MPCDHTYSTIARCDGMELGDFRCRARAGAPADEEDSPRDAFAFIRRGVFERRVGSCRTLGTPNQILYYAAQVPHRTLHPAAGGDDCTVITLDRAALLEALVGVSGRDDAPPRESCPLPVALHLSQWRALRRCAAGAADAIEAHERVLGLVAGAIRAMQDSHRRPAGAMRADTRRVHRDLAHDAASLLATRYDEPWTLDALARAVHSSPFHLARIFRREMGLPIHRWLLRLRLREAVARLAAGADDLTALALDLGFASRGHLSDALRAEFGLAPSFLRAEFAQG